MRACRVVFSLAVLMAWMIGPAVAAAPIAFSKVAVRMAPGTQWWTARSGGLCDKSERMTWDASKVDMNPSLFEPAFREAMAAENFSVSGDQDNLFEDKRDEGEYIVGGVITNILMKTCMGSGFVPNQNIRGEVAMSVEWQVYSKIERKVVAKIPTSVLFKQDKPIPNAPIRVILGGFGANAQALARDQTFRNIFLGPGRTSTQALKPIVQTPLTFTAVAGPQKISDAPKAVVLVLTGEGHGSGILISKEGHILTNEHVVGAAKFVKVRWSDGIEGLGEVIRTDRRRDIALIKADPQGRLPLAVKTGPSQVGDTVFAIGAPLDQTFQSTVTRGVVSANRTVDGLTFIQSDVTVNPGNSGGPLINETGAVIGLTDLGYQPDGVPTNINLFIPIADALTYLNLTPG